MGRHSEQKVIIDLKEDLKQIKIISDSIHIILHDSYYKKGLSHREIVEKLKSCKKEIEKFKKETMNKEICDIKIKIIDYGIEEINKADK